MMVGDAEIKHKREYEKKKTMSEQITHRRHTHQLHSLIRDNFQSHDQHQHSHKKSMQSVHFVNLTVQYAFINAFICRSTE